MRLRVSLILLSIISGASAQSDRGTITGTVTDPAGAVIAAAAIEARNIETNARYPVASSVTGNYTLCRVAGGHL